MRSGRLTALTALTAQLPTDVAARVNSVPSGQQNIAGLNAAQDNLARDSDIALPIAAARSPWARSVDDPERVESVSSPGASPDLFPDVSHDVSPKASPPEPTDSYARALARLFERVKSWQFQPGEWLRHSEPVSGIEPMSWLQGNDGALRCFWQGRGAHDFLAGLGVALELSSHDRKDIPTLTAHMQRLLQKQDGSFLGGMSFSGASGTEEWAGFPAVRFLLPALELRADGSGQQVMVVNLLADTAHEFLRAKTRLLEWLCRLRAPLAVKPEVGLPRLLQRTDVLSQAQTESRIQELLAGISAGKLRKAVLARRVDLQLNAPIAPFHLLRRWRQLQRSSYCFALEAEGQTFMGCTPERLFLRRGRLLETESLAGTVRRGKTADEDAALGRSLHQDPKLVHEHALVTEYIRERIAGALLRELPASVPQVFKLDRIQHRYLPLTGILKPEIDDADLLAALHPTPAVCGLPRADAEALIREQEPVQRGWYSGVVGQLSRGRSEFAVAIRSVLVQRERIYGYSGVGIVAGSEPRQEWQELEAKIESFLTLLQA